MFFRIDWFDLLAVQRTLKSLLQSHSSKASILWCSPFFMVQISHPYILLEKTFKETQVFQSIYICIQDILKAVCLPRTSLKNTHASPL